MSESKEKGSVSKDQEMMALLARQAGELIAQSFMLGIRAERRRVAEIMFPDGSTSKLSIVADSVPTDPNSPVKGAKKRGRPAGSKNVTSAGTEDSAEASPKSGRKNPWEGLTPEQRAERVAKIKAGQTKRWAKAKPEAAAESDAPSSKPAAAEPVAQPDPVLISPDAPVGNPVS